VLIVSAIYLACNYGYLLVLPLKAIQHAPADRVGPKPRAPCSAPAPCNSWPPRSWSLPSAA
jgi:hypothetical protein